MYPLGIVVWEVTETILDIQDPPLLQQRHRLKCSDHTSTVAFQPAGEAHERMLIIELDGCSVLSSQDGNASVPKHGFLTKPHQLLQPIAIQKNASLALTLRQSQIH